jgi:hypothetical protein
LPTIATIPTLAQAAKKTRVVFTLTGVGANYIRVWCTNAPEGSVLSNQLRAMGPASSSNLRVQVYEGDGGRAETWRNVFDKGGLYTLKAQEYTKVGGRGTFGGGYLGDPRGAPSETKVGAEATLTLTIGERLTHRLGFGKDQATLVVWVWNASIRRTSTTQGHGESTPSIVDPTSERARIAMGDATVRTRLSALDNASIGSLFGTPDGLLGCLQDLQESFDEHIDYTGRHSVDDTDNAIGAELVANISPDGFPTALARIARKVLQHVTNDNGAGPGSAAYHNVTNEKMDWLNAPIMMSCSPDTVPNMLGDLFRAIYNHAGGNGVPTVAIHGNNTTTGQLPGVTTRSIPELHKAFFDALAKNEPTSTIGQGSLAAALGNYGFKPG